MEPRDDQYQGNQCSQPADCCSAAPCIRSDARVILENKLRGARERVAKFEALLKLADLAEPGTPLDDALAETARWTS
jgi:hypothetical protein